MAKVKPHGASARRQSQQAPSPSSEPASPQDQDRLAHITKFAETLFRAARQGGHSGGPYQIVANAVGMSPSWSFTQIQKMVARARRGLAVSWEVEIKSPAGRSVEIVQLPMLEYLAAPKTGAGRPRVFPSSDDVRKVLDKNSGLKDDPRSIARALGCDPRDKAKRKVIKARLDELALKSRQEKKTLGTKPHGGILSSGPKPPRGDFVAPQ